MGQPASTGHNYRVDQTGKVTPGHAAIFDNNGLIRDAGSAASGLINNLGITPLSTNPLAPFCINDAPTNSPIGFHELCMSTGQPAPPPERLLLQGSAGALLLEGGGNVLLQSTSTSQIGGQITYNAYGGAPSLALKIQSDNRINLISGSGVVNVNSLPPTVAGDVPLCVDSTGRLYQASSTEQAFLLTDDANSRYLTDDTGSFYLVSLINAGECQAQ